MKFLILIVASSYLITHAIDMPSQAQINKVMNQMQNNINQQMWHQQMQQMMFNYHTYNSDNYMFQSFIRIYCKDRETAGFGMLVHERDKMRKKDKYFIEMGNERFLPEETDSVFIYDKKGIPDTSRWLFTLENGEISVYSHKPYSEITKVSIGDSLYNTFKKSIVKKKLKTVPFAFSIFRFDNLYAIRMYNQAKEREKLEIELSNDYYENILSLSRGKWAHMKMYGKIIKQNENDITARLFRAKKYCSKKKYEEAKKDIDKVKEINKKIWLIDEIEGYCLEKQKNYEKSLKKYRNAFKYAPMSDLIIQRIKKRIKKLENKIK